MRRVLVLVMTVGALAGLALPASAWAQPGRSVRDTGTTTWLVSSAGWSLWMETWGAGTELDLTEEPAP